MLGNYCGKSYTTLLPAQEGINAFLLQNSQKAVQLIDKSLTISVKITDTPTLILREELQLTVINGRIQQKNVANATKTWDVALGATYMRDRAIQMCVPPEAVIVEDTSWTYAVSA